jgi:DNA-binding protein HU-beta
VNKSELVESVASDAGVSKSEAEGVINAFFETVRSEAKGGNTVGWPGFGKFFTRARPAGTARNPRTNATVKVKATSGMKFRQSSVLKTFLNTKGTARKAPAKSGAAPAGRGTSAAKKASGTSAAATKASTPRKAAATKSTGRSNGAASTPRKATATKAAASKAAPAKAPARKAAAKAPAATKSTTRKAAAKR